MSQYDKQDAAKDTGASIKEVSAAWHTARDDAGARSDAANAGRMDPPSQNDSGKK